MERLWGHVQIANVAQESSTLIGIFLICQRTAKNMLTIKGQWEGTVHVTQDTAVGAHLHFHHSWVGSDLLRVNCAVH